MDTIIKKISVRANYNELIVDSSMAGFDYLDVSRRSFQRKDFRITDSFGKTINLKNLHWSFSIIFQKLRLYTTIYQLYISVWTHERSWVQIPKLRNVSEYMYQNDGLQRWWSSSYLVCNVAEQLFLYRWPITLWIIYICYLMTQVGPQLYESVLSAGMFLRSDIILMII